MEKNYVWDCPVQGILAGAVCWKFGSKLIATKTLHQFHRLFGHARFCHGCEDAAFVNYPHANPHQHSIWCFKHPIWFWNELKRMLFRGHVKKKKIICLMLTKKKIAVFWLTARDAEIYPRENDLHLQADFDLQAVELDSTSLVLCFSHRLSIHSANIYWAPTIARPSARCLWRRTEGDYPRIVKPWSLSWRSLVLSGRQTCEQLCRKLAQPKPKPITDAKGFIF